MADNNIKWFNYLNSHKDFSGNLHGVYDFKTIQDDYKIKSKALYDELGIVIGITKEIKLIDPEDGADVVLKEMINSLEQLKIVIDDISMAYEEGAVNYVAITKDKKYYPCCLNEVEEELLDGSIELLDF